MSFRKANMVGGGQPVGLYLPNSNKDTVICEAYVDNYDHDDKWNSWGYGISPIRFGVMTGRGVVPKSYHRYNENEDAVYIGVQAAGDTVRFRASVDLVVDNPQFTAYFVGKLASDTTSQYPSIIGIYWGSGNTPGATGIISATNRNALTVANWNSSTVMQTGLDPNTWFVTCLRCNGNGANNSAQSYGCAISKAYPTWQGMKTFTETVTGLNRGLTLGYFCDRPFTSTVTVDQRQLANIYVKYFGVTTVVDSDANVKANVEFLLNKFL